MRLALSILIGIHGIIHLFGFLKAFEIAEFNGLHQPISKSHGIIWLLSLLLFLATLVLFTLRNNYWWIISIASISISQILIINNWSETKFGTLLNLLILSTTIIEYSNFSFNKRVDLEINHLISNAKTQKKTSNQNFENYPTCVQKWLKNSGILKSKNIKTIFLKQDVQMLMKPEQKSWNNAKAKQYFSINPPAFNWSVSLKMNSFISLTGRDKLSNGKGEMLIKLWSLIPIVNVKNNEKINEATLQRYLAEIVWFPIAALSKNISWKKIDQNTAKATITYNGTVGSGIFYFDENGNFKKFTAMRYKDKNHLEPSEWIVSTTKYGVINGIKIPLECKAEWKLENGTYWNWLKLKITEIEYN